MIFTILIVFFSLITLIILHELGHFWVAKKFGVKVEEFGVFLPPRLYGKKIGETIYSINLIPFGAFVRVFGEEGQGGDVHDIKSFLGKPVWQRALIVSGGVLSFWLVAFLLLTIVMGLGIPTAVSDQDNGSLLDPKVRITAVSLGSPAQEAGLRIGDTIRKLRISNSNSEFQINTVKEVQKLTEENKGKEVVLIIERGKEVFEVALVPRTESPEGQGHIGIALARIAQKQYPWHQAPIEAAGATVRTTGSIIAALAGLLKNLILGRGMPEGATLMGPVGIGALMTQFVQLGLSQYLHFLAVLSIYFAVFNVLPIPALDGGKLLFLFIEKLKGRPVNQKFEQKITVFFFGFLLLLIMLVTIRDIARLL